MKREVAISQVALEIESKYYHDTVFGRKWKHSSEDNEVYDKDTAPGRKYVRESLAQIEGGSFIEPCSRSYDK